MAHVKDLRVVTGAHIHIEECPLGEGVTDWVTALRYFNQDLPEDGFVVLEHAKSKEDALTGLRNLHAAADKAGVKFT